MNRHRPRERLADLFLSHQHQLHAELTGSRENLDHPTLKADASEAQWRAMLERYLPRRYRMSRGIVADSRGAMSEQIDPILHDAHYCPLFRDQGNVCIVPAESVYAVFDAKQELDARAIREAADKVASVRQLFRTSGPILDRGVKRRARRLPPMLGGVLALTAVWSDGLGRSFRQQVGALRKERRLDLGCALDSGAFELSPRSRRTGLSISPGDTALLSFFMALLRRLQQSGTVPAIDWTSYERVVLDPRPRLKR